MVLLSTYQAHRVLTEPVSNTTPSLFPLMSWSRTIFISDTPDSTRKLKAGLQLKPRSEIVTMKKLTALFTGSAIATVLTVAAAPAQAALVSCTASTITVLGSGSYTGCSGSWTGNDSNQQAAVLAELGATFLGTWDTDNADKSDSPNFGAFTSNPSTAAGTLTFDSPLTGIFAIALKSSTAFSLFAFNGTGTGITGITYTNNGVSVNRRGIPQGLSHAALYTGSTTPVPEPLTILGSVAALGLGSAMRRRRNEEV
jgi:hypothetical protein